MKQGNRKKKKNNNRTTGSLNEKSKEPEGIKGEELHKSIEGIMNSTRELQGKVSNIETGGRETHQKVSSLKDKINELLSNKTVTIELKDINSVISEFESIKSNYDRLLKEYKDIFETINSNKKKIEDFYQQGKFNKNQSKILSDLKEQQIQLKKTLENLWGRDSDLEVSKQEIRIVGYEYVI